MAWTLVNRINSWNISSPDQWPLTNMLHPTLGAVCTVLTRKDRYALPQLLSHGYSVLMYTCPQYWFSLNPVSSALHHQMYCCQKHISHTSNYLRAWVLGCQASACCDYTQPYNNSTDWDLKYDYIIACSMDDYFGTILMMSQPSGITDHAFYKWPS